MAPLAGQDLLGAPARDVGELRHWSDVGRELGEHGAELGLLEETSLADGVAPAAPPRGPAPIEELTTP